MVIIAKINNDKYYTPPDLAKYIVTKTKEIIGEENIIEYIEPSAGAGVFLDYFDKPYLAYDIEPEDDRIIEQDFLKLELDYKKGRCIIGNPPYGRCLNLAQKFFKKSITESDYVVFILPISQLNNTNSLFEFDLIYSENLGKRQYSDREVHCCFNIYKRPVGKLNKRPDYKLKDVEIIERIKNSNPKRNKTFDINTKEYDIRMLAWGAGTGRILTRNDEQYAKEFIFIIHNIDMKNKIIDILKDVVWENIYPMTATPNLSQWQVYKYIKEQIPGIN